MSVLALVEQMIRDGSFNQVVNNPAAQFGPAGRVYLGATLLPERPVQENAYTEEGIRYRSIIANDGTRYSPVQKKKGVLVGSFEVRLGNSDIGSEFTSADYDALLRILRRAGNNNIPMEAVTRLIRWADTTLNRPLLEKNEKMRWEAIVDASVVRQGDNNYVETVPLSAPTGHRPNAGAAWSTDATDPMDDILALAEVIKGKGYEINRMIAGSTVIAKLVNNGTMRERAGTLSIISGTVAGQPGRVSRARLDDMMRENGLPPIEEYNLQYRTSTGSGYFLKRDVFVMVATTGQEEVLDFGDSEQIPPVQDTLGYTAVGRAAGQEDPGRVTHIEAFANKPPRIEGEAWQTSFPVITEPEAIGVIKSIT